MLLAAAALLHHAPALSEAVSGDAAAIIREGVKVRATQAQTSPSERDDSRLEGHVRTVSRPCNPAEPSTSCKLVLIEMQ